MKEVPRTIICLLVPREGGVGHLSLYTRQDGRLHITLYHIKYRQSSALHMAVHVLLTGRFVPRRFIPNLDDSYPVNSDVSYPGNYQVQVVYKMLAWVRSIQRVEYEPTETGFKSSG